jgi:hypothetical protein
MIRKALSILFAGLILFNLFGYYFVFRCDQARIKREMRAMLRNGSCRGWEEITVQNPESNPDFKRIDSKEFRYQGRMYDIISVRFLVNSVVFRCINDTREEQLIARYEGYSSLVAGMNVPEKNKSSRALLHHIIKQALTESFSLSRPFASVVVLLSRPSAEFNGSTPPPPVPPPRVS